MSTENAEDSNFDATVNNQNDNEIQVHIKTLENKKTINMQKKFKEKAISQANKISNIKNNEHLQEALKQLNSIEAFIDATSNNNETLIDFTKTINEPPNKKLKTQNTFYSIKKIKNRKHSMIYQNQLELKLKISIIYYYKKKNYILSCNETEHSYVKK